MKRVNNSKYKVRLDNLIERYPVLHEQKSNVEQSFNILDECFSSGHKLLVAGNGGSASDAEHIVGELMKGFLLQRPIDAEFHQKLKHINPEYADKIRDTLQGAFPAVSLVNSTALNTAFMNDVGADSVFAQQINGLGQVGDVFLGITTSGNSENIIRAAIVAKALGMKVIGLTGQSGGKLLEYCDVCITVPEKDVERVQELHLPVYHTLCLMLEDTFFVS